MRITNLLKIAAEAEALRLRALAARQGRRAAFGAGAGIFALGVLVLAEVAGWLELRGYVTAMSATLILLGVNLVIAAVLGVLAAWSKPSQAEQAAQNVRQQALDAARGSLALAAAVPLVRSLVRPRPAGEPSRRTRMRLLR